MRTKLDHPKCLICNSKDRKAVFSYDKPDQYEISLGVGKEGYFRQWLQCDRCGFYYSISSKGKNIIKKIYRSNYRDKNSSWRGQSLEESFKKIAALPEEKSETKFRVAWIKKTIEELWDSELIRKDISPYNMLDIGGGIGIFAYEFQDKNWSVHVIDPNKESSFIRTKLRIPFLQKYYKPNSFRHKFHLIALNYVLEHLSNPLSILKTAYSDLTSNGLLYIEVPDAVCFHCRPPEDDIFNSCHLWMFSPNTLTSLLDSSGFEIYSLYRTKVIRGYQVLMVLAGKKYFIKKKITRLNLDSKRRYASK